MAIPKPDTVVIKASAIPFESNSGLPICPPEMTLKISIMPSTVPISPKIGVTVMSPDKREIPCSSF